MTHPAVEVLRGGEVGRFLYMNEPLVDFTMGSDDSCNLVFRLARVAGLHASLFVDDDGHVIITDARSLNGVFVNGRRITEHTLKERDEISLGPPGNSGSALNSSAGLRTWKLAISKFSLFRCWAAGRTWRGSLVHGNRSRQPRPVRGC